MVKKVGRKSTPRLPESCNRSRRTKLTYALEMNIRKLRLDEEGAVELLKVLQCPGITSDMYEDGNGEVDLEKCIELLEEYDRGIAKLGKGGLQEVCEAIGESEDGTTVELWNRVVEYDNALKRAVRLQCEDRRKGRLISSIRLQR